MPATFILSLDCEGKWGVADHLDAHFHDKLTDDRLRTAYRDILGALKRYDIAATFAFVGLFSQTKASFSRLRPLVDELAALNGSYLVPALHDIDLGSGEGWCGDWAVDLVISGSQEHEIAFHGASHVPWDQLTSEALRRELAILAALEGPVQSSKTMVFPRNREAHQDELMHLGIEGYRVGRASSRVSNLLSEFNPFARSESRLEPELPIRIPAGYFINYQNGLRKAVPRRLSKLRTENIFSHAARTDGIIHFWLHPENVAFAPATMNNLEDVLCIAARERDKGRCVVQTQLDYCDALLS